MNTNDTSDSIRSGNGRPATNPFLRGLWGKLRAASAKKLCGHSARRWAAVILAGGFALLGASNGLAGITQRGTARTAVGQNSSTITIAMPTGVVQGDIMIANIAYAPSATANPSLTGWTLIDGRQIETVGKLRRGAVLYKVAGASESGPYSFNLGISCESVGGIVSFTGVNSSNPFDATLGTILVDSTGNNVTVNATAINNATAYAAIIMFGMAQNNPTWSGWTTTTPGALTELFDVSQAAEDKISVGAAWAIKASTGSTGVGSSTLSVKNKNGGILIALKPAVVATKLVYTTVPSTGTAGTPFSVTVQSQDASGNPVNPTSDTTITLSKATGGGSLSGTLTGTIPASGNSVTIATPVYSKSDTMTLTATATAGMTGLTPVTSGNIVFSAGAASKLAFTTQPSSVAAGAGFGSQTVVAIQDANGNTVASGTDSTVSVSLTLTTGTGTLGGTTTWNAVAGIANFSGKNLTINLVGTDKVLTATATISAGTKTTTTSAFTITAASLNNFAISSISSPQTAGTAITGITLTAQDAYGNTVTGFSGSGSNVTYSGTAGITGTSGSFTAGQLTGVSVTPLTAGNGKTLIVTGNDNKTGTATFDVTPGAVASYVVTAASPQTARAAFLTTVTAKDAYGNTVTNDSTTAVTMTGTGSVQFDSDGNSTFGDITKTLTDGTFTISTLDNVVESVTMTATSAGGKTGTSSAITVNPALRDFQSHQSGDWSTPATWERWDGAAWVSPAPTTPTAEDGVITIRTNHHVTVPSNVSVDQVVVQSLGQITVSSGVTLALNNGKDIEVLDDGVLLVNGILNPGKTVIVKAGTLIGNGKILGPVVVQSGGILAPGTSVGTLTVTSNVTFEAGSTYTVQVNPYPNGNQCDKLDLSGSGSLTLGDGVVALDIGTLSSNGCTIVLNATGITGYFCDTNGAALENNTALHLQPGYYIHYVTNGTTSFITLDTSPSPTSSGIDLRAYQSADGVYVEFVAYDVERNGSVVLSVLGADGKPLWTGTTNVLAGERYVCRFQVPGLTVGATYTFAVRDEVGKGWTAPGVTVSAFAMEMVSLALTGVTLSFGSLPDREYEIQWTDRLGAGWQTWTNVTADSDRTRVFVTYPDPKPPAGFFRIHLK